MSNNFRKLISKLRSEIKTRAAANNPGKYIPDFNKSHANNRAAMAKAITASRSLNKALTPTRAEIKLKNQKKMRQVRKSIKEAILTKGLSGIEIIKLENPANNLQAKLYQRDLI